MTTGLKWDNNGLHRRLTNAVVLGQQIQRLSDDIQVHLT